MFGLRHRLALALDHSGVSVHDMADELGVSRNTVGNYLAGRTRPAKAVLRVWALRTGTPYEWLSEGRIPADMQGTGGYPAIPALIAA